MGLVHVTVTLKVPGLATGFEGLFLVDTGATDSVAPAPRLKAAGIVPIGSGAYEHADGSVHAWTSSDWRRSNSWAT